MQKEEDDKEFDLASEEHDAPSPLTVTSRVSLITYLIFSIRNADSVCTSCFNLSYLYNNYGVQNAGIVYVR